MKCERCWSEHEVEELPTSLRQDAVFLCQACRSAAPDNPILLQKLFLPFAARKELLRHYETDDEYEALRQWCTDVGMEVPELSRILATESDGMGLLSTANPLEVPAKPRPPYGYAYQGGRLVRSPLEAEVITAIFNLCLQGKSLDEIRHSLERAEVPTKRGGEWHRSTLHYLLRNPLYAGFRRWKGSLRRSSHPAIVDPDRFERVQLMLSHRCRRPDQKVLVSPLAR